MTLKMLSPKLPSLRKLGKRFSALDHYGGHVHVGADSRFLLGPRSTRTYESKSELKLFFLMGTSTRNNLLNFSGNVNTLLVFDQYLVITKATLNWRSPSGSLCVF